MKFEMLQELLEESTRENILRIIAYCEVYLRVKGIKPPDYRF